MELVISPKKIAKLIFWFIAGLTVASSGMKLARHLIGDYPVGYRFLDVDSEQNIPTWYTSKLLLACAALLALIALTKIRNRAPYRYHWAFLAVIFAGLSLDEAIGLHEELIEPMQAAFNLSGIWYFGWVLPAIAGLVVLAFAYLKFFRDLPVRSRRLFFLAAGVYLGGALGMEMVNGSILSGSGGTVTSLYNAFTGLEEFLEMVGINIFVYALLSYLVEALSLKVFFEPERVDQYPQRSLVEADGLRPDPIVHPQPLQRPGGQ
ncbi:MAG TPA: hypothetical protein V6D06_01735 [Trichocoleus sp.]